MSTASATLISGPVLRRASVEAVYVWMAFDNAVPGLNAEVYKLEGSRRLIVGQADADTLQPLKLGKHLYVYLVRLVPNAAAFEHDQLYFYEVVANAATGSQSFFEIEGSALAYPGAPVDLPSFFLPAQHKNILQASCRKPHAVTRSGKNVVDQYAVLDELMGNTVMDVLRRPSQLFLTGDQIYADDVALPLLLLCSKLGRELTGIAETLPTEAGVVDPYKECAIDRREYCNKASGFTSDFAQHHLLTFAEYTAMYLLVSGGVPIKQRALATYDEAQPSIKYSWLEKVAGWVGINTAKRRYKNELATIGEFLRQAKYYRRVLANVPTYMMVDDHDVTDDWNLTRENADKVRDLAFSRRVITNALAAAWVFQLWGNDPERFGLFKNAVNSAYASQNEEQLRWLEEHFIRQRFWWGCVVPDSPPALVLDTRTRRAYAGNALALMDDSAFAEAKLLLADVSIKNSLVLLSPAPMFGFSLVEAIQLKFKKSAATVIDREPWIANLDAMRKLKDFCMVPEHIEHVLILSGDVHYGFHRYEKYKRADSDQRVHFWQLTSSSVCNIPPGKSIGQSLVAKWLPWIGKFILRAHLKEKARYLLPDDYDTFISADTNVGLLVLDNKGNPQSSCLYCADAETQKTQIWHYDLKNPQLLEI